MSRNPIGRPPSRAELLDAMSATELAIGDVMRRWDAGIPAEVRAELMDVYRPVLLLLIRAGMR